MTSTKPRSKGGRPKAYPRLREMVIRALRKLRKPGTRRPGVGRRGPSKKTISYSMIRAELPESMRGVNDRTLKDAIVGLKRDWNYPRKEKSKPLTNEQFVAYCLSQNSQGW